MKQLFIIIVTLLLTISRTVRAHSTAHEDFNGKEDMVLMMTLVELESMKEHRELVEAASSDKEVADHQRLDRTPASED